MSKADQLAPAGSAGECARSAHAARPSLPQRASPPKASPHPQNSPSTESASTPDNPRSDLGDLTDLAGSLKTHGQKQAITVMNRDAYIKANPEREADLEPDTTHVVVDGSSRLAAAREAGLDTLKVMVSDYQGTTPKSSSNPPSSPTSTTKTSKNSTKPALSSASWKSTAASGPSPNTSTAPRAGSPSASHYST